MDAYLAARYGSGAKAEAILERSGEGKRKKKKRKIEPVQHGLVVDDNGYTGWEKADEDENEGAVGQSFVYI
jgi:pre-mRNA-splicing factor CWC26